MVTKKILITLLSALLITNLLNAQKASFDQATLMANQKMVLDNKEAFSIKESSAIQKDETTLFYLFQLNPAGYIVVSPDRSLQPVIAFSYNENIDEDGKFIDFIEKDISKRISALAKLPDFVKADRQLKWQIAVGEKDTVIYWPEEGSTTSGGWMEFNWTQNSPYNRMVPMDPVTHTRSYAGCPAVAMGQILNFHKTVNGVFFDDGDDYYHNYAGRTYWIDDDYGTADFPDFPTLNLWLDSAQMRFNSGGVLSNDEKAAVIFACGTGCTQVYTSEGSGTFGVNQALDAYHKFNFDEAVLLTEADTSLYPWIIQNIKDTLPVHLAVVDEAWSTGHNVVIDGYNSDNYFHLNFGWGGSANGWYLLPDEMPYSLTVVEGAVVDIVPDDVTNNPLLSTEMNFRLFPNPAVETIYFGTERNENFLILISDIYGMTVYNGNISGSGNISLSNFSPGYYFLTAIDLKNQRKCVKPFTIVR
ncbi:MAG: hypothetical protein A2W91_03040 [Bacteroidetes bacterium GWF2_38_335]|nr:MAG: hypothetical protein A2W91_03040 [Bacteroidetes bacterium GWF2_38_335]OFY77534.1 MAG: hypothetical protein A2281_01720 [Bacteroidetes bacterium RIFOXYA12_FULL_38_20]HBS87169.1 hypothetical protein [Bacteroidales bacterium]